MLHRDKILAHAALELPPDNAHAPGDRLQIYKRFLKIEEHRLRLTHRAGGGGLQVCQHRAELLDVFLRHLYASTWDRQPPGVGSNGWRDGDDPAPVPLVLLATGGYGRGELNPFSDVDILFLHAGGADEQVSAEVDAFVKKILYLLWDVGFKVGHATRSIEGAIAHANADSISKTSLLQARLLAGDTVLAADFYRRFEEGCIRGQKQAFLQWRKEDQRARFAKFGQSVFMQEPNVKFSAGGLRDLHNLVWSARFLQLPAATLSGLAERKLLSGTEQRQLERAYDFLLRVRTELHYLVGRPGDVLTLFFQGQVATRFGYPQTTVSRRSEAFMKDYYRHARNLHLITETVGERLQNEAGLGGSGRAVNGSALKDAGDSDSRVENFDGFYSRDGQLHGVSREIFNRDPTRLLRVFAHLQERDLKPSPELTQSIRRNVRLVDRTFTYARVTREIFMRILSQRGRAAATLRLMHELDVLGRYLPEFGGLDCLVQHEFVHRYSADEHTLVCLEKLDALLVPPDPENDGAPAGEAVSSARGNYVKGYRELFKNFKDPLLLYLGLLLHDTGKSTGARHHAEASALFAQKVAARLQLSPERRRALILLVDHHLTLSMTAQTRNLDDHATVGEFAGIIKNKDNLDALMLLTFADGQGTTDQGWSDWKESLVWQLYHATVRYLAQGEAAYRREQQEREVQQQAVMQLLPESFADEIDAHFHHMPARYFDTFDAERIAEHVVLFRRFFASLMPRAAGTGGQCADAAARPSIQPAIQWVNRPERGHTKVLIAGWKRRALLTKIAGSFSAAGLNILSADSFIRSDLLALEIFRVCDFRRRAVTDARDIACVERHLATALAVEQFDFSPLLKNARRVEQPAFYGDSSVRRTRTIREVVPLPTRILTRNDPSSRFTLLEVQAADRLGLLYDLLGAINKVGVQVMLSRIATDKGAAFDSFYLVDRDGGRLTDQALLGRLRSGVREAALGDGA